MQTVKTFYGIAQERDKKRIESNARGFEVDLTEINAAIKSLEDIIPLKEAGVQSLEDELTELKSEILLLLKDRAPKANEHTFEDVEKLFELIYFYEERTGLLGTYKQKLSDRNTIRASLKKSRESLAALTAERAKTIRVVEENKKAYTERQTQKVNTKNSAKFLPIEQAKIALLGNGIISLRESKPSETTLTREDFSRLVRLSKALDEKVSLEQDVMDIEVESCYLLYDIQNKQLELDELSHYDQSRLQKNIDVATPIKDASGMLLIKTRVLKSLSKLLYRGSSNEVTTAIDNQINDSTTAYDQYAQLSENLTGILCRTRQDIFEKQQQISVKNSLLKAGDHIRIKAQSSIKDIDTEILTLIRELLNEPEIGYEEGLFAVYSFLEGTNYELNTGKGRSKK